VPPARCSPRIIFFSSLITSSLIASVIHLGGGVGFSQIGTVPVPLDSTTALVVCSC
jgi:hypothetical protein